ncbi:MAG TPA: RDD family protein [Candidatus Acidoferrum sp.]|nr:RDD family protein [Candidatus Acidoferrum sp.]
MPRREAAQEAAWRSELAQRLTAYRTRRRKRQAHSDQSQFAFEAELPLETPANSVAIEEPSAPAEDDFSFTIAIGRPSKKQIREKSPMEIDVSLKPEAETSTQEHPVVEESAKESCLFPVASIDDRRIAGVIDLFCLLFAYGGFLGLFGSLGGHFTLSKLSVAVCVATFSAVYMQYFALFTIFGGTTPGMMVRGLRVLSFAGDTPSPKQMLLRSAGYLLSAGAFFLGFLWAMWDEDALTWHDRLSSTYLSKEQTLAEFETSSAAHSR